MSLNTMMVDAHWLSCWECGTDTQWSIKDWTQVEEDAARAGWTRVSGEDYCPQCSSASRGKSTLPIPPELRPKDGPMTQHILHMQISPIRIQTVGSLLIPGTVSLDVITGNARVQGALWASEALGLARHLTHSAEDAQAILSEHDKEKDNG